MARIEKNAHIVVLCAGNRTRSPMAAAILSRKLEALKFPCKIESAGVLSRDVGYGVPASRRWRESRAALTYDLSQHVSRHIGDIAYAADTVFICAESFAVRDVLALAHVHQENVYLLNPPNGIPDPSHGECSFEDCFTLMYTGIAKLINRWGIESP